MAWNLYSWKRARGLTGSFRCFLRINPCRTYFWQIWQETSNNIIRYSFHHWLIDYGIFLIHPASYDRQSLSWDRHRFCFYDSSSLSIRSIPRLGQGINCCFVCHGCHDWIVTFKHHRLEIRSWLANDVGIGCCTFDFTADRNDINARVSKMAS